jgi:hypothetical protein
MKRYNYYYDLISISRAAFLRHVPENWETEVDEFGVYSYGLWKACEVD